MRKDSVQYKGKWHTSVDNDIIRNVELSFPARFLWILLKSYASPSSPVPYPGFETLAHFMSSFRKDRHSQQIERKPMDEDTLRKYRQELVDKGFLIVERIRNGFAEWENNRYILLDGSPHPDFPGLDKSGPRSQPGRSGVGAKEVPVYKGKKPGEAKSTNTNSTPPAADVAATASEASPSAPTGAAAPEPPPAVRTPENKAEHFIKGYMTWAARAKFISTVIPRERDALIGFFKMNPQWDHRGLLALMLLAWQAPKKEDEQGLQPWWHCNNKGWRIKTFLDFLTNIQDEVGWQGTEKQVNRAFNGAEKFFPA